MHHIKLVALASLLAGNAAFAANTPLPAPRTAGPVSYLSGGIGVDESTAFKRAGSHYPLELEFVLKAKPRDEYASDVAVHIMDAHGKTILATTSEGPFLLARLPDGRYRVQATKNGKPESQVVEVAPGRHQRVVFAWAS